MSKKVFFQAILGCFLCLAGMEQRVGAQPNRAGLAGLKKKEDSLQKYARQIVFNQNPEGRFRADSFFIRTLVRALKIPYSFYYPFDSVNISKLYSPDSTFRVFTWQVQKDEMFNIQRGAIQIRTSDGSLKLIGLHDVSMFTNKPLDSVRGPDSWIGAIYYRIILKEWQGKKIYTLLGYDEYSIGSNKKWMEILTFNSQGEPVFGGPYISFKEDSARSPKAPVLRFNIEYKKDASATFNYDPSLDMIVYDQLISESDEVGKKETYVPDGDYEGFKWKDGMWVHVPTVFRSALKDGEFPAEQKILDDAGAPDEQKLKEQSEKNMKTGKKTSPPSPAKATGN